MANGWGAIDSDLRRESEPVLLKVINTIPTDIDVVSHADCVCVCVCECFYGLMVIIFSF
jgi:hypothetical protein